MQEKKYRRKRNGLFVITRGIELTKSTKEYSPATAVDFYRQEILDTRITLSRLLSESRRSPLDFLKKKSAEADDQEYQCLFC